MLLFYRGRTRPREAESLAQGHTAHKHKQQSLKARHWPPSRFCILSLPGDFLLNIIKSYTTFEVKVNVLFVGAEIIHQHFPYWGVLQNSLHVEEVPWSTKPERALLDFFTVVFHEAVMFWCESPHPGGGIELFTKLFFSLFVFAY